MLASRSARAVLALSLAAGLSWSAAPLLHGQAPEIAPVTDAMLQDPAPEDWLMWRRTLNGWGYSPLDQIDRANVGQLRMVWTRGLGPGLQQGTPLVHRPLPSPSTGPRSRQASRPARWYALWPASVPPASVAG